MNPNTYHLCPWLRMALAWIVGSVLLAVPVWGQAPDEAAMMLDGATRALQEKNYPFATQRYREFLQKYGGHKEAPRARYGLALSLIDGPTRDYQQALEQLNPLAGARDFTEQPYVLYYLGVCQRGLGNRLLAQGEARPNETNNFRESARPKFEEAGRQFTAALQALNALQQNPPVPPRVAEFAARSRCDLAEMHLRAGKTKEALATVAPFLDDKTLASSRHRGLGLYYHGFASFLLGDLISAGRSLSKLEPFSDPIYGTHTRYLLARIHHLDRERQEAATAYEQVIGDHAKHKAAAIEALKNPDQFKNDPDEKARLETLARGMVPDHVGRSLLYLAVLQYEDGKFAEALAQFKAYQKEMPSSPLAKEAKLREGFCQVQLKQYNEAIQTLQGIQYQDARLADRSLFWLGKAQLGMIDQAKPLAEILNPLKSVIDTQRRALERVTQIQATDPGAKVRRAEIQAEMADTQQLAHLYKEAATTYAALLTEKSLPDREEELTVSLAGALQLAGETAESQKVCARFLATFPKSPLLPAILFRSAENANLELQQAEKKLTGLEGKAELTRLADVVLKRYQTLVDQYPEFSQVNLARYGMALAYFRKGELEKAREKLEAIPAAERTGPLAVVSYQLADCLLRLAPVKAENAITAGQLDEALKAAIENLTTFVGSNPNSPQTPDAMLKLGTSLHRQAGLLAAVPEKQKVLQEARTQLDLLQQRFPKSDVMPQGVMELARVINLQGDPNGAINQLRRFQGDPLKNSGIAPLALLQLSTLLRAQNRPQEAVDVMAKARQAYEGQLVKDTQRGGWAALLQLQHGLALREMGKRPEAQMVFDQLIKTMPDRPEAIEASLRSAQCRKDEAVKKIGEVQKRLATPGLKPEEKAAVWKTLEQPVRELQAAAKSLADAAAGLKEKQGDNPLRARMLYEAAWGQRLLGDLEIESARDRLAQQQQELRRAELAKKVQPGQKVPVVPLPEVAVGAVPQQPGEKSALEQYRELIAGFGDLPLSNDARFELAEMLSRRKDYPAAVKILREALDKEISPELTDKIRVALGSCLEAQGERKAAEDQFQLVLQNPRSPLYAQALYRSGEGLLLAGDFAESAKRLSRFRDDGAFQNLPGLSDRALFRLGQALEKQKQYDASRQAHEQVVNRFPSSRWAPHSRYGIGWSFQNLQQYDNAVNAYGQVVNLTATELGARAQMNIGLCRMAQKRYGEASNALLVVPYTYNYPDLNALSLLEAARALAEDKQKEQAIKVLERLLKDHPESDQAQLGKQKLEMLKKS